MTQSKKFAILRVVFGLVWAVDASLKWQPGFFSNFSGYLGENAENQIVLVKTWANFWTHLVGLNPHLFAFIVAISETVIAFCLIFGFMTRSVLMGGAVFSVIIWSTAESFGGPYSADSTDIGAAIIYVLVFFCLLAGKSWETLSIDSRLSPPKAEAANDKLS